MKKKGEIKSPGKKKGKKGEKYIVQWRAMGRGDENTGCKGEKGYGRWGGVRVGNKSSKRMQGSREVIYHGL